MVAVTETPKRSRWFRFSLRTAAVVLTLLCIWLGIVATRVHRQRTAVEAIVAAGGNVYFDYQFQSPNGPLSPVNAIPPGPAWLRRVVGEDYFRSPHLVVLAGPNVTDELIENHLSKLTTLTMLRIESPQVTDRALPHIARLHDLFMLRINSPKLTVEGLRPLGTLKSLTMIWSFHDSKNQDFSALDESTSMEFVETPLKDVADYLGDFHQVRFDFDSTVDIAIPITSNIKGVDLRTALHQLLDEYELGFKLRNGAIVITSRQNALAAQAGKRALEELFPNSRTVETDW